MAKKTKIALWFLLAVGSLFALGIRHLHLQRLLRTILGVVD